MRTTLTRTTVALAMTTAALGAMTVPAAASTAGRCTTQHLSLSLHQDGAAAGTTFYDVVLTNSGRAACTLTGYPGVSARTSPAGPRIGHAATRDAVYAVTLVTLAPGEKAHARLGIGTASDYPPAKCRPAEARAVAVYPPGAFDRLARPLRFETCARRSVHLLSVTTVVPGG